MHFKVGDICKHFKGNNLIEKNIYEIVATNVTYTGDNDLNLSNIIVYRSIFQDKYFAREEKDLLEELDIDKQEKYHQVHRVELLTESELDMLKDEYFIKEKEAYIASKY